jgi:hypothetical protein
MSTSAISLILLGVCASLIAGLWGIFAAIANPSSPRARRIAIGFDQTLNAATSGNEDKTISSRAYTACQARRAWGCLLCRALDLVDKNHCEKSKGK